MSMQGTTARYGGFSREILLTEGFFDHLREHAVPFDENAVRQIRESATSLDLYTWLSYRLPRIQQDPAHHHQLASTGGPFRQ